MSNNKSQLSVKQMTNGSHVNNGCDVLQRKRVEDGITPGDLLAVYQALKSNNIHLLKQKQDNQAQRDKLKNINDKLNLMLQKQKPKKEHKYLIEESEDVYYKELQNATN